MLILGFVLFGFWSSRASASDDPMVAGEPLSWWLKGLPQEADQGFLDAGHPLERAGPEIIPGLIRAIERPPGSGRAYRMVWQRLPGPMSRYLPAPSAPEHRIRCFAAFRLGQFGVEASPAVPVLSELLGQPIQDSGDHGRVIQALGYIGPSAKSAIPALTEAVDHANQWVSSRAVVALLQIGVPPDAIPHLEKQVDGAVRGSRPAHQEATATVALWVAEPSPKRLARVHAALGSDDPSRRAHTARTLAYQANFPEETVMILHQLLSNEHANVRQGAAIALAKARQGEGDMDEIVSVLTEGVRTGEFQVPCARTLGALGSRAGAAIPALEEQSMTPAPVLRRAVLEALEMIRGQ
jgi:HEAT repeat protein